MTNPYEYDEVEMDFGRDHEINYQYLVDLLARARFFAATSKVREVIRIADHMKAEANAMCTLLGLNKEQLKKDSIARYIELVQRV